MASLNYLQENKHKGMAFCAKPKHMLILFCSSLENVIPFRSVRNILKPKFLKANYQRDHNFILLGRY